ncbi:hypothetical protein JX265_007825 [Neoarthrinium moseri]|uniref:Endonuclease/exonuclease/phosphatase domain-containing protein n=1 Tax=Neoarthrinium moseri TaxID=1658444 RepID=A0A9Q0AKS2_9PEZI|nr:hypothetical protein JX265_007825 [Neoarthrinium moseri]
MMDEIIQKAIRHNEAVRKTNVPWKADEPYHQPYFTFDGIKQEWVPRDVEAPRQEYSEQGRAGITRLALLSWNIDFMLPYPEDRMCLGLSTLQDLISKLPKSTAFVIYLQECVISDLSTIEKQLWVRERFNITDLEGNNWTSGHYGTTTLIDRRLPITSLFRVHYEKTRMERDAFFVDVSMGPTQPETVRLCNTHLESLAFEPPFRPPQVQLFAKFMHESQLHGAVAAGDFNAIQDFDRSLHEENGLKDAYLELGGKEDSDEGYTWGQQAATQLRDKFGCSRMDKVYYCGRLKLLGFERFGADVQLQHKGQRERILSLGFEKPWITDHLGVMAEFEVVEQ